MKFKNYLDTFRQHLIQVNCSPRTVDTYAYNTEKFLGFLERYYPRIGSMEKVTKEIMLDYQRFLLNYRNRNGHPLSIGSQILKLKILRAFFSFLAKNDFILKNPASSLTLPKEEYRLTRNVLTEREVFRILSELKTHTPVEIRDRAIVELFYACGIRTSELCNLKIQDVDLKEQTVTILKGKGGKSRIVPIGQYASHYIQLYLAKARRFMLKGKHTDAGYLFLSQRGNPFDNTTINKAVMGKVGKLLGKNRSLSCYSFRHATATHLLANKVDIAYIAKLLGHASLKTTQRYAHVEIGDLKKMHSLYHPREKVSRKE